MNITGIGSASLNSYLANVLYNQNTVSENDSGTDVVSLSRNLSGSYQNLGESIHIELSLKDGSTLTIDYQSAGVQKKTAYELAQYGDYTYGNNYFSSENTAKRILDFARSLWDGSSEKLEILSKAIDQGVNEARQALGTIPSWLSNLIGRTEDLLQQGLADMKSEIKVAA